MPNTEGSSEWSRSRWPSHNLCPCVSVAGLVNPFSRGQKSPLSRHSPEGLCEKQVGEIREDFLPEGTFRLGCDIYIEVRQRKRERAGVFRQGAS